jgi:hypothetical protein
MVSLMASGYKRGNRGEAKKASRTAFVLHSRKAGGQLRTRRFGLMPLCISSMEQAIHDELND